MKASLRNAQQIHDRGGVVPSSEWTNGSGRWTTRKAVPPFCALVQLIQGKPYACDPYNGEIKHPLEEVEIPAEIMPAWERVRAKHPKAEKFIVMTDPAGYRVEYQSWLHSPLTRKEREQIRRLTDGEAVRVVADGSVHVLGGYPNAIGRGWWYYAGSVAEARKRIREG